MRPPAERHAERADHIPAVGLLAAGVLGLAFAALLAFKNRGEPDPEGERAVGVRMVAGFGLAGVLLGGLAVVARRRADRHPPAGGIPRNTPPEAAPMTAPLFTPLTVRGVTFRNRVVVSPMCQYCAADGLADDWHLVHLGQRAAGGAGLVFVEAAAVVPEGRITPGDMGIWSEAHVPPLARVASFLHREGAVAGIQLAHAGRKASCQVPWEGGKQLPLSAGGWPTVAPSPVPFRDEDRAPDELDEAGIRGVLAAFRAAAERSVRAGFRVVEIHAAHGYLLHEFLSPLSNKRMDHYGGGFENRTRLLREVATALRGDLPADVPLFVRVSATDWADGGWDLPQTVELAKALKAIGVDLIDCSGGALVPHAKIPVGPGYQVPFAAAVKKDAGLLSGAVGLITDPAQANDILVKGEADLIFLAREFLREPYWTLKAADALGADAPWPVQYGYAVKRR